MHSSKLFGLFVLAGLLVLATTVGNTQQSDIGMGQRINMVMVPTQDVEALRSFYADGLGWTSWGRPSSGMFKVGTSVLVLLDAAYLEAESGIPAATAPKSIFAVFVESKEEVDRQMSRVAKAGGTITSAVRDRDGGLYTGYFTDPEGNGWEIVWSPSMPLDEHGALTFPN